MFFAQNFVPDPLAASSSMLHVGFSIHASTLHRFNP